MNKAKTYLLPINKNAKTICKGWLFLGISSLALAGLFAVILVFARADWFSSLVPIKDFFKVALTIHVNLSVLVWLLSFICLLIANVSIKEVSTLDYIALILACVGVVIFSISPFLHESTALLNNYIPMLENPIFKAGMIIFGIAITLVIILAITRFKSTSNPQVAGIFSIALILMVSLLCFYLSFNQLSVEQVFNILDKDQYYELLFWGGGHVLQFAYVAVMLIAWIWLATAVEPKNSLTMDSKLVIALFILNAAIVLPSPYIYSMHNVLDFEYKDFFTMQMRYGGGVAPLIIGFLIMLGLFENGCSEKHLAERNALIISIFMFAAGGFLGFSITEINTVVPAHYHGSIVAVTLSLMGLTYYLLPHLGYGKVSGSMAYWQPFLYGGGQLLHIIGLAVSGGYGALRKTPGAMESFEGKMSMGLMGLGGMLSVIGGLLFVIIVFRCIFTKSGRRKNV